MKILELFSGYGTASFALKRLGIDYELVGYSDIDKYANQCFKQNHCPEDVEDKLRLGDVRTINPNELPDFDLLTAGFPCQSFSNAGKMLGETDARGTLFYEIIRIAEVKQPKYMLLENVKGLTSKRFQDTFNKILNELDRIGYNVYWKVLNSKDYGIPQSRARVWFVCFRKDIDVPMKFQFPEQVELKIFIKDILEEEVDSKYFLSEKLQERFRSYLENKDDKNQMKWFGRDIKTGKDGKNPLQEAHRIYDSEGISQTIKPIGLKIYNNVPMISNCEPRECGWKEGISPTLKSRDYKDPKVVNSNQLRRLTPKECFRLMGFLNDEINLEGLSDTQKYKLAGNGQDVNMVTLIFKEMFK